MAFALGAKSLAELAGVDPRLVAVVKRAIEISPQDFAVHDGLRTEAEQTALVRAGASQTMNSMHRKQADGFGHAVVWSLTSTANCDGSGTRSIPSPPPSSSPPPSFGFRSVGAGAGK